MTELVKVDAHAARAVAGQIRQGIHDYLATLALISKAWEERHWQVLGYDSWQSYVDGEFGAERLRLPADHRRKAVEELRLAGMSQRAIGTALGVGQSTVRDDLAQLSGSTQLPERAMGTDGRERSATRPQSPAPMPEPEPEASTSTGSGRDHPPRTGEADARLAAADGTAASEAPTEGRSSVGAGDSLADAMAAAIDQAVERAEQQRADREALYAPREVVDAVNAATHFVPAMVAIQSGCEDFLSAVKDVDPEKAVTDLPDDLRHRLDVARNAHHYLSRVVDALNRIGVPA